MTGEDRLPMGKWTGLLLLSLCMVQLLMAHPVLAAPTLKEQLHQALLDDASHTLNQYLQQQGWSDIAEPAYQIWLSPAVAHLPLCQQRVQLQAGAQHRQPWGRRPYQISCAEPAWQLRGRVEVSLMLPVWVMAQSMPAGHLLVEGSLMEKIIDVSRLQRSFIASNEPLLGAKSRRQLKMGQLVSDIDLQQHWTVRRGEEVLITAVQGEFSASTRAEALNNGMVGDAIKVRNRSSGKEVQAWVTGKGEVETRF